MNILYQVEKSKQFTYQEYGNVKKRRYSFTFVHKQDSKSIPNIYRYTYIDIRCRQII